MEWDVVLFSGIFRCHLYGNAVRFLLVTDRCTAWKALNGNVSEAEFYNLQQIVLCENQKVSIEKKLASTILLVLMICATAAFVWFTFLAWLNNFGILNSHSWKSVFKSKNPPRNPPEKNGKNHRRISFIVLALFRLCLFPLQKTSLHFSELSSTPASHLVPSGSLGMLLSSFSEVQRIRCSSP